MNREIIHSKTLPEPTTLNELAKTFVVNSKVMVFLNRYLKKNDDIVFICEISVNIIDVVQLKLNRIY